MGQTYPEACFCMALKLRGVFTFSKVGRKKPNQEYAAEPHVVAKPTMFTI